MARLHKDILETIGHTPLVRLNRIAEGLTPEIYAKIEFFNPGGSIKDRIGLAMIEAAEKDGRLKPGGTIVEGTAGNTGVGLAIGAAIKGYRCICALPDKMSEDKIQLLKAYGVEVVITPSKVSPDSPEHYHQVSQRLANEIPGGWFPDQFSNPDNPRAHYETTGPEIWEDTDGKVDVLVAGMGTTGTITGAGKYLKEKNPNIKIVVSDPIGSIYSGGPSQPYKVEGIGLDYIPKIYGEEVVDEFVKVSDKESFNTARRMAREEGILMGGSSGTAIAGALKYAATLDEPKMIVVMVTDTGRNYINRVFSDRWMQENGFWEESPSQRVTVGEVLPTKDGIPNLVHVGPGGVLADALDLMHRYNISQVPVVESDRAVGSIQETSLMKLIHDGVDPWNQRVSAIMGAPLPEIDHSADVSDAYQMLLNDANGVVVTEKQAPRAVLTRIDLINYYARRDDEVRD